MVLDELNEIQKRLLLAALVQNLRPGVPLTANCVLVVGTAIHWAGLLEYKQVAASFDDEDFQLSIKTYYGALIELIQHKPIEEALFEGAGNFGTPKEPKAHPHFTACRLTTLGEQMAETLLEAVSEPRKRLETCDFGLPIWRIETASKTVSSVSEIILLTMISNEPCFLHQRLP
jgi:hypothetical protein